MNLAASDERREDHSAGATHAAPSAARLLTVPNVLTCVRLAGAPVLLGLAFVGRPDLFAGLFVLLAITDWLDGKLAILLKQRTVFGARLDSWADAACYTALLLGALWLRGDTLWREAGWLAAALASYTLTTGVGYWKFGRWPSYHTRAAKTSWLLVIVGTICLLGNWSSWPLRIAMVGVTFTNLEATLISWVLPTWHVNVPSLYHAWKLARQDTRTPPAHTKRPRGE